MILTNFFTEIVFMLTLVLVVQTQYDQKVKPPYGPCEVFILGGVSKHSKLTKLYSMTDDSAFAFYPLTNEYRALHLHIRLPNTLFKVIIIGTHLVLKECKEPGHQCHVIEESGRKTKDYITSNRWNIVKAKIQNDTISITIGPSTVMTMPLTDKLAIEMPEAQWYVTVRNKEESKTSSMKFPLYMVQFECLEPVTTEYFNPGLQRTSQKTSSMASVALIIGVCLGIILLAVIALVIFKMVKNRKSETITDQSRLGNDYTK